MARTVASLCVGNRINGYISLEIAKFFPLGPGFALPSDR